MQLSFSTVYPLLCLTAKSQVRVCPQICLRMITVVWICQLYSGFTYVSPITQGRTLLILGSKGQRSQVCVDNICSQICFQMTTQVWISHLCLNLTYVLLITWGRSQVGVKGQKVNVTGQDCLQICFCIKKLFLYQTAGFKKT